MAILARKTEMFAANSRISYANEATFLSRRRQGGRMAYPISSRPNRRYLGNVNTMETHDLKNETLSCQVDEIIAAGHAVVFYPDSRIQAESEGYESCAWCLGFVNAGRAQSSRTRRPFDEQS